MTHLNECFVLKRLDASNKCEQKVVAKICFCETTCLFSPLRPLNFSFLQKIPCHDSWERV